MSLTENYFPWLAALSVEPESSEEKTAEGNAKCVKILSLCLCI